MSYSLPPSLRDLSIDLSPYTEEAEKHTRQWLKNLGLEDNSHAAHQRDIYMPGLYAGYMWPHATRDNLNILSDLTGWFSCQDDVSDEELGRDPVALEKAIRNVQSAITDTRHKPCGALAMGLADIVRRAGVDCPEQWTQRTVEQCSSYLYPCLRAAIHHIEGTQPASQDFEAIWRNAGGFQVCVEFTYWVTQVHLSSTIYYCSVWQELRRLTLNILKAVNDLLSFRMMENPDEDVYNLLTHLRHHQAYSADQAAAEVGCRIEEWADRFLKIQTELPSELEQFNCDDGVREQVVRCAEALKIQWHGNIGWHLAVPRYKEVRFQQ